MTVKNKIPIELAREFEFLLDKFPVYNRQVVQTIVSLSEIDPDYTKHLFGLSRDDMGPVVNADMMLRSTHIRLPLFIPVVRTKRGGFADILPHMVCAKAPYVPRVTRHVGEGLLNEVKLLIDGFLSIYREMVHVDTDKAAAAANLSRNAMETLKYMDYFEMRQRCDTIEPRMQPAFAHPFGVNSEHLSAHSFLNYLTRGNQ